MGESHTNAVEGRERGGEEAEFEQLEYVPDNVMARYFAVRDKQRCRKVTFSASAALGFFFFSFHA